MLETHGGALLNVLRSSGGAADLARAGFQAAGLIPTDGDGDPDVPDWFPLAVNLRVLDDIARTFGDAALFEIGLTVRDHARFPPQIRDLREALAGLDIAFHTNHRCDGAIMYDPATGHMLEGIGHYRFRRDAHGGLVGDSTSVYPCAFDLGIIAGLAARFDAAAVVQHAPDGPCRKRGDLSCTYVVSGRRSGLAPAARSS